MIIVCFQVFVVVLVGLYQTLMRIVHVYYFSILHGIKSSSLSVLLNSWVFSSIICILVAVND